MRINRTLLCLLSEADISIHPFTVVKISPPFKQQFHLPVITGKKLALNKFKQTKI